MSNITPITPSFVFGYWRPWKEDANVFDSYLDYTRDVSLMKYGAEVVGTYINEASAGQIKAINQASTDQIRAINKASKEQIEAISQASKEQLEAINQLGREIGRGMNVLSNHMVDINNELHFLNRNVDIQIEQQKLGNLLLQNIAELLRVPDSEKERQHSIELGIKFFVNAAKDSDLYADALEELLKAEFLMKQDYFVLNRIGCIYLHAEKYINPEKALEYFLRAAKYASVESDAHAVRLANVLTNNFNTVNSALSDSAKIGLLVSDSYEKASFSAYVLGQFANAVTYQSKALKFNSTPQNRFLLSKYQIRNGDIADGIQNLERCIDDMPVLALACFKEIDLVNEPEVLKLVAGKNKTINQEINTLMNAWKDVESAEASSVIKQLADLLNNSYEIKVSKYDMFRKRALQITDDIYSIEAEIDSFITKLTMRTFKKFDVKVVIDELKRAKDLPFENMKEIFYDVKKRVFLADENEEKFQKMESEIDSLITKTRNSVFLTISAEDAVWELNKIKDLPLEKIPASLEFIKEKLNNDRLRIGMKYAGGIIFYLDESGKHGKVCADIDFGIATWGSSGETGCGFLDKQDGMQNTRKIVEIASWEVKRSIFGKKHIPVLTAARLCLESQFNGFNDWYLPTSEELGLVFKVCHPSTQSRWAESILKQATAKIDSKINFVLDEIINAPFLRSGVQEVYWSSSDGSVNGKGLLANYAFAQVVLIVSDGKQLQMKEIKQELLPRSTLANVKAVRAF